MKKLSSFLTICALTLLCSCGGKDGNNAPGAGSGPLAPLAEKYLQMGINDEEIRKAEMADKTDKTKLNEMADEVREKNEALEAEAVAAAETLNGKTIPCEASEGTGLSSVDCVISKVNASSTQAVVVLDFMSQQPFTQAYGCLFENSKGEVYDKLQLYTNGVGTPQVAYMFSARHGGKTSLKATDLTKLKIVTKDEYSASPNFD